MGACLRKYSKTLPKILQKSYKPENNCNAIYTTTGFRQTLEGAIIRIHDCNYTCLQVG